MTLRRTDGIGMQLILDTAPQDWGPCTSLPLPLHPQPDRHLLELSSRTGPHRTNHRPRGRAPVPGLQGDGPARRPATDPQCEQRAGSKSHRARDPAATGVGGHPSGRHGVHRHRESPCTFRCPRGRLAARWTRPHHRRINPRCRVGGHRLGADTARGQPPGPDLVPGTRPRPSDAPACRPEVEAPRPSARSAGSRPTPRQHHQLPQTLPDPDRRPPDLRTPEAAPSPTPAEFVHEECELATGQPGVRRDITRQAGGAAT